MISTRNSRRTVVPALVVLVAISASATCASCGFRWVYKSTIFVGTTDPQQAFYSALIAVNAYHYPFAEVDASAGRIVTGQVDLGSGHWCSFDIQVLPTGEVQIDPVTNWEKSHEGGVLIPRGVLNRANNIGRYIRKVVVEKTPEQIAVQGEGIHQSVLSGLALSGANLIPAPDTVSAPAEPSPVPPSGG